MLLVITYQPMNGSYSLDLLFTNSVEQSHCEDSQLTLGLAVSEEPAQSFTAVTKGLNFVILRGFWSKTIILWQ